MAQNRAKFSAARELAYTDITSSFKKIGSTFEDSFRVVYLQNLTDAIMDFSVSFEGTDTAFSLAPTGTMTLDITANGGGGIFQISAGESAWVKYRSAPTTGFVQFSSVIGV